MIDLSKTNSPLLFSLTIIISSLIYVVGLAWNEFFKSAASQYISESNTTLGYLIYSILMTLFLIIIVYIAIKLFPTLNNISI